MKPDDSQSAIVRHTVHARAALAGNPSDGYHGKTIAFTFENFGATVTLWESPEIELQEAPEDDAVFESVGQLVESVEREGYYGGIRLMKAAVVKFVEYCRSHEIGMAQRNFTMRYVTNIPRQIGLGGSSAIITAAMRALMKFYEVEIPDEVLPNVVLSAEKEELGITAGLQDRVVQAYRGLVYMDFDKAFMDEHGYGRYKRLDYALLPPLYIAYRQDLRKESGRALSHVRELHSLGDRKVVDTMNKIAVLADEARQAILDGRPQDLSGVMNRNFDLRAEIYSISPENMRMVSRARSTGASCTFCGSGGSVVGSYDTPAMLESLRKTMAEDGCELILPKVTGPRPGH